MTDIFLTRQLTASRKDDVFYELGDLLKKEGLLAHVGQFVAEVKQREHYGSTYIGHGVAVPHYQTARASSRIVIGTCRDAVDWLTDGHAPVQVVLLFVINMNGRTNQVRNDKMKNLMIHLASEENLDNLVRRSDKMDFLNQLMEMPVK